MIDELIPAPASTAHTFTDHEAALHALYPQEAAAVAGAVLKRRREYASVRMCARRAMTGLGVPSAPLLAGRRGAPQWPAGLVGSMTHCAGYRAAVVGRSSDYRGLGIDAEPNSPMPSGLLEFISLPQERDRIRGLTDSSPGVCWDRLLFSAKEAVFKAWYPITGRELDFSEADIFLDSDAGTLSVLVNASGTHAGPDDPKEFSGRWLCRNGLVLTAVALERPTVDPPNSQPYG